jgi:hypothetical protein
MANIKMYVDHSLYLSYSLYFLCESTKIEKHYFYQAF